MKRGLVAGTRHAVTPLKKMVGSVGEKGNLAYDSDSRQATTNITMSLHQLFLMVLLCLLAGLVTGVAVGPDFVSRVSEGLVVAVDSLKAKVSWGDVSAESVLAWKPRES
jgi:hypothetical protein